MNVFLTLLANDFNVYILPLGPELPHSTLDATERRGTALWRVRRSARRAASGSGSAGEDIAFH